MDKLSLTPLSLAFHQISLQAIGRLIAVFGVLCQQFHHDIGERDRNILIQLVDGNWWFCQVAVDNCQRVIFFKWESSRKQLVESHTERIKVCAVIDDAVDTTCLFW